jgi:iron-sulfur cluster repair protein YtfE (RIC family)
MFHSGTRAAPRDVVLAGGECLGGAGLGEPVAVLLDAVAGRFHETFQETLPRLEALVRHVVGLHGRVHGVLLITVGASFLEIKEVLQARMRLEEEALFPAVRNGEPAAALVRALRADEWGLEEPLKRLRELTSGYDMILPPSPEWGALWRELALFDLLLVDYLRLEREALFPRLVSEDPGLSGGGR